MSKVNENFDFDAILTQVENTNKVKGQRTSLTSHLYNALNESEGKTLSMSQIKLLARAYQFNKASNLAKFKAYNNGKALSSFDDIKLLAATLSQSNKATDKAMFKNVISISKSIEKRMLTAVDKVLIEGSDKRSTNIPYASEYYALTTLIEGDKVSLVER